MFYIVKRKRGCQLLQKMRSCIVWAVTEVNMGMYEIVQRHLKGVLGEVSEREREVLVMRFGLDGNGSHTMDEVGERFGLSHEEIRKIEEKALGLTSIGNFEVLQKT